MEADLLANLAMAKGKRIQGGSSSDADLIKEALAGDRSRPVCVVRDWLLIDVMVSEEDDRMLIAQGLQPTILFAHEILFDSRFQAPRPGALRSSFQRTYSGSVFESNELIYLLAGDGLRKQVSAAAILELEARRF
ncbi:hypothetical protein LU676_30065 [Pseudomonas alloputida]|uniref:DUF6957 family protein n=1 Tax=Pseudomonas putida group TaxID=136845 RepID=UPI000FD9FC12|nr:MULTISPECIES: hypothetical protein [Pseudomonas putida group]MCE0906985.1 hypothetical protein [Pseudomonas alloputida]MDD2023255.1 hypothetical protein [Pseudomonas putida]